MALEGTLNYLDIAHLLQVVGTARKSGVLEVSWQEREARLFFESGRLIRAESNRDHAGIGTLLVEAGVLTSEQLQTALDRQRHDGEQRRLGAILCDDLGIASETLQDMLSRQFEQIVFEVFSWPGGRFVFEFSEPEAVLDRFHLNPVQFILDVGVQAGLLAERGVSQESADPGRIPIATLVGDEAIARACIEFWRRRGHRVIACERAEEVLGLLELPEQEPAPLVLVDVSARPREDGGPLSGLDLLERLRVLRPEVLVVALEAAGSGPGSEAMRHGARQVVRKPAPGDLAGPEGDSCLEVFLLRLEMTVSRAIDAATHAAVQATT